MAESVERDTDEIEEAPEKGFIPIYDGLTIHQRIHAVMQEVGHLEKDKIHEIKKDGRKLGEFPYISHDAVTAHIRPAFIKWGVMVIPTVVSSAQNGNRAELTVEVDFINLDEPADKITVKTLGHGVDKSDKGPGKAFSYAVKYAYMKLLMLNSADDIEKSDIEHDPEVARQSQVTEAEGKATDAQIGLANNLRLAIDNAQSIEALEEIQADSRAGRKTLPDNTQVYFTDLFAETKRKMAEE